jgi:hypothetical protein
LRDRGLALCARFLMPGRGRPAAGGFEIARQGDEFNSVGFINSMGYEIQAVQ